MSLRSSRPIWLHILAVAFALFILAVVHTPAASADVCTGGAPDEPSGSPSALLGVAAVPFLHSPRWSKEVLPQWSETSASGAWGDQLAYAWYPDATLWGATSTAAWWVIPGLACSASDLPEDAYQQEGNRYEPEVCVLIYSQLALTGFDCLDPRELSRPNLPVWVKRGSQAFVAGFAPPASGSVEVRFQSGNATFPVAGGVYAGAVSARLGRALGATEETAPAARAPTAVVLVDQTGLYSSSQGPLASTPRLKRVAAAIHSRIPSVAALTLGTAVKGHRPHDQVLYGTGSRALASRVARALHAAAPSALAGGALQMFRSVARVVVLVGHAD
jgi:hypothetical protein